MKEFFKFAFIHSYHKVLIFFFPKFRQRIVNECLWDYKPVKFYERLAVSFILTDVFRYGVSDDQNVLNQIIWSGNAATRWHAKQTPEMHTQDIETLKKETTYRLDKNREIDSVIELGCGGGYIIGSLSLLAPGRDVKWIGVDISDRVIEIAREKHKNVKFVCKSFSQFFAEEGLKKPLFIFRQVLMFFPPKQLVELLEQLHKAYPTNYLIAFEMLYEIPPYSFNHNNGRFSHNYKRILTETGYYVKYEHPITTKGKGGKRLFLAHS